jgi:histo-blood group ABO system transferase
MKIGLLTVATGPYLKFIPALIESAREFLFPGHQVQPVIFSDSNTSGVSGVRLVTWLHRPWPDGTLYRYHAYWQARGIFGDFDFLLACDADMRFVSEVNSDIIDDLVGTQHPGFVEKRGSYEDRQESTAFVASDEGKTYFCGGFVGGRPMHFLSMARTIARSIDADKANNLIAVWHDESHLNRYFIDNPPTKVLSPAYCTPEGCDWFTPTEPAKVLALAKDHGKLQK